MNEAVNPLASFLNRDSRKSSLQQTELELTLFVRKHRKEMLSQFVANVVGKLSLSAVSEDESGAEFFSGLWFPSIHSARYHDPGCGGLRSSI